MPTKAVVEVRSLFRDLEQGLLEKGGLKDRLSPEHTRAPTG